MSASSARFAKFAHLQPGPNVVRAPSPYTREELVSIARGILQGFEADGIARPGAELSDKALLFYMREHVAEGRTIYSADELLRFARRRADAFPLGLKGLRPGAWDTPCDCMIELASIIENDINQRSTEK